MVDVIVDANYIIGLKLVIREPNLPNYPLVAYLEP